MSYELLAKFTEFVVPSEMKNLPIPKNELNKIIDGKTSSLVDFFL